MDNWNYSLEWAHHKDNLVEVLRSSLFAKTFTDITLVAEGREIRAHKCVLSTCSLWFREIILANNYPNLVIVMLNVDVEDLEAVIKYAYTGELFFTRHRKEPIMDLLQILRMKGLVDLEKESSKWRVPISKLSKVRNLSSPPPFSRVLKAYFPIFCKRIRTRGFPNTKETLSSSPNANITHGIIENRITMQLVVNLPSAQEPSTEEAVAEIKERLSEKNKCKESVARTIMKLESCHLNANEKDAPSDVEHTDHYVASASGMQQEKPTSSSPAETAFNLEDYLSIPALADLEIDGTSSDSEKSECITYC